VNVQKVEVEHETDPDMLVAPPSVVRVNDVELTVPVFIASLNVTLMGGVFVATVELFAGLKAVTVGGM
jgi:hypothetical protein